MKDTDLTLLARSLGRACVRNRARVATAESCTGGGVGEAITRIAGSSGWYERGFVVYSNEAKRELLGVPRAVLERFGAVSEEVARKMARGALEASRADYAVAVTGVAGPGGGTRAKPVGMVCFAWAARGRKAQSRTRRFRGGRAAVRRQSIAVALQGLLDLLA